MFRAQVRHVIGHAGLFFVRPAAPPARPDKALLFFGDDAEGRRWYRDRSRLGNRWPAGLGLGGASWIRW